MADLIENIKFDEVINPENYTDFEQLGKDIEKRNENIANAIMEANQKLSIRYKEVMHDTGIDTEELYEELQRPARSEIVITEKKADIDGDGKEDTIISYLTAKADTDPMAANELGVIYYLKDDVDLAVANFQKAADMDYAEAQRNLAIALEQGNSADKERIFNLYSQAAEKEDAVALNNLGCCYLDGDGTEENVKKAIKCFEAAISKGDDLAKINLADCYSIGNGVRANAKKAFNLYSQAAENGNPTALKRTAECYLSGQGTPQDFRKAMEYYQRAADLGDVEAQNAVAKITDKIIPKRYDINEQLPKAEQQPKAKSNSNDLSL